ncbi:MAG: murein biosynthesis integral membrane protein MurJ [Coriobacteriales bacterium]
MHDTRATAREGEQDESRTMAQLDETDTRTDETRGGDRPARPEPDDSDDGQTGDGGSTREQVARSTAVVSAATLLSRVTGFFRTWACAFALGNTLLTSAYQIANSVPNMLYEFVAGGLLSTAFLPVYLSQRRELGEEGGTRYAANLFNLCIVVLGVVALLATVFAPQVIFTQTFVTGGEDAELATFFFRFFAIQVVFYGASAIISGVLNANKRFLWPALGPVANNIVVIVTFFGFVPIARYDAEFAKVWLAVGTSLGILVQAVIQIPALRRSGFRFHRGITLHGVGLGETARLAIPAIIFTAVNLVCVSVRNAFSLGVSENGPATLSYAWLWYQLPYGVLAVALSTTMFTEMSSSFARGDADGFRSDVRSGLRGTFFLIIPMAVLLFVLATMLVTLYHAGRFTTDDVMMVAMVLRGWAVCLPFYAGYMYLYFAFSARKDLMTVTKVNTVVSLMQIALYALLTTGVGSWHGLGLIGIPLADTCFFVTMFVLLYLMLRRRTGGFSDGSMHGLVARVVVAAALGGAVAFGLDHLLGTTTSIGGAFVHVVVAGCAGLVVIYGLLGLMHVEEMSILRGLFGRLRRTRD